MLNTANQHDELAREPCIKEHDSNATIVVTNKANGTIIRHVPVDDRETVRQAADRARNAQRSWGELSPKQRSRVMKQARKQLVLKRHEIADLLEKETGKPPFDVVVSEIFAVCSEIGYLCKKSPKWLKPSKVSTYPLFGKQGHVIYKPRGLIGVISPWNSPLNLSMGDAVPALLAGNAVIIKPSEVTPLAVTRAVEIMNKVLPEGILQVVNGYGATGEALVRESDMLAVTGSCATGKRVMLTASEKLTPVLLELGGKDPMIVLADADLDRAAKAAAWGSCMMTGQVCMSIERIYVDASVAKVFKSKLLNEIKSLRTGPERQMRDLDFGPFIGPQQQRIVQEQIADALQKGAVLETGGRAMPSNRQGDTSMWFEPTMLSMVDHSMKIMTEETFGPVASVMEVKDVEEAVRLANSTEYGLNASVWTQDIAKGRRIAEKLESGSVCINEALVSAFIPSMPFGGAKMSGLGTRHGGAASIQQFCRPQAQLIEKRKRRTESGWFPTNHKMADKLDKLMGIIFRW